MPYTAITEAAANTTAITTPSAVGPATSGWLSLPQLTAEVLRRMGGRADLDTADVVLHINEAYLDLCSMVDFDFMTTSVAFTTEAAQPFYLVPKGIREVIRLSTQGILTDYNPIPLQKIDVTAYRALPDETDWTDVTPHSFVFTANNILVLWPTPDTALSMAMEVKLRPARLSLETHYPALPEEWQEALLLLAQSKTHDGILEFEMASQKYNQYLGYVRSRRNERAEKSEGTHGRVFMPKSAADLRRGNRRGY